MYLLAHRYHQISFEIPFVMKEKPIPDNFWLKKPTVLTIIGLNLAAAVFVSVTKNQTNPNHKEWSNVAIFLMNTMLFLSSLMLILAVAKIRETMKD